MAEETPPTPRSAKTASAGASSARMATVTHAALIGRAGSGKTAVAQAIFGARSEPVITGAYARYRDGVAPIIVDDVAGWINGSESTLGAIFSYLEAAKASDPPLGAIWYTLDASSARVTDYELRLIQRLARMYPVVVALTRADLVTADTVTAMSAAIEGAEIPSLLGVIPVSADPLPALGVAPYGIDEVMSLTPRRPRLTRLATEITTEAATPRPEAEPAARVAAEASRGGQAGNGPRQAEPAYASPSRADTQRDRTGAGGPYGASEMDVQPSRTLIAVLILVPLAIILALALFFLGRRRSSSEEKSPA